MPLAGEQLTLKWSLALAYHAGFRRIRLVTAVAVMCAESGRWTRAWHDNLDAEGNVVSTDRGLFQINNKAHPSLSDADAYSPIPNAVYAAMLSHMGASWKPWSAFLSGAHLKFMPIVTTVWLAQAWRTRIRLVESYLGGGH